MAAEMASKVKRPTAPGSDDIQASRDPPMASTAGNAVPTPVPMLAHDARGRVVIIFFREAQQYEVSRC